jgi:hypothetical protein
LDKVELDPYEKYHLFVVLEKVDWIRLNKDVEHPIDMPKLQSPFVREVVNGVYVCTPKIDNRYRWVFTEEA